MARVHAAFVIKQERNESLRTGSRVVVTVLAIFQCLEYWWFLSESVTFLRGKFSWDSSLRDSIRYAKELYCVTKIPLESTETQDVAQGNRVRAWSQIEFNQTVHFFHAVFSLGRSLSENQ